MGREMIVAQESAEKGAGNGASRGIHGVETPLRFVVTVDTEADAAWWRPDELKLDNLTQLPRFQDLCDRFDVVPTYLLTYECAHRDEALEVLAPLAAAGRCEIGHHLHVWSCPPFSSRDGDVDRDWILAHQFLLPDDLFFAKAERLRREIERNFGRSPTAHRAGRWGIDQRTVDWLVEAAFVTDTSLRPSIRLLPALGAHAATRLGFERSPFLWRGGSASAGNAGCVVEIPATVDFPDAWPAHLCRRWLASGAPLDDLVIRAYRKLGGQRMLRPDPRCAPAALIRIFDAAVAQGVTVVNLMLHSSELALGCSPFSTTPRDVDAVWAHLTGIFSHARRAGILSQGLTQVARLALRHARAGEPRKAPEPVDVAATSSAAERP